MATRFGLIAAICLLFIALASMILVVFDLSGLSFLLSMVLLVCLLSFSFLSLGGAIGNRAWGWSFLSFLSLILVLFTYFVYMIEGTLDSLSTLLISSITLLIVSFVNFRLADAPRARKRPSVELYGNDMEKMEPISESIEPDKPKRSFSKGSYVASQSASTYHLQSCE